MDLYRKILILTCFGFFGYSGNGIAEHLVGGEIFYECIGNNRYVITLKMYRDCNGIGANFDNFARIGVFRASDNSQMELLSIPFSNQVDTLAFNQNIPCLVDTPDVCISTTRYIDTVELQVPLGGIHLVHQRCCRPPNVVNINNVASTGSTYHAFIPDQTVAPCNSSPSYNSIPPTVLCANVHMSVDYSATDKDGDSLVYSLCRPYHGGTSNNPAPIPPDPPPFQYVSWSTGFNDANQITALPQVNIDPNTGILTGRPTQLGTFAFGVCVQEWRDGIMISENKRDFQLTTGYCEVDAAAAIDSAMEECIGFDIQFFNMSTLGESYIWNFGDSSTSDDTSSYENPIYTYTDTGTYTITLIAYGDVCNDTTQIQYRVQHKIEPHFEVPDPECLDRHLYKFTPAGDYRETTQMRWEFKDDTATITDLLLPVATKKYDTTGVFHLTLHYTDPLLGCYKSYSDSVEVWPNPKLVMSTPMLESCIPFRYAYGVEIEDAYRPSFTWYFDSVKVSDSSRFEVDCSDLGYHDLGVIMITDSLCIDTVSLDFQDHILVLEPPQAAFSVTPQAANMFTPEFTLHDESSNRYAWKFFIGEEYLTTNSTHHMVIPDTGNHLITQIAFHRNGCEDTTYQWIRVEPEYLTYIPNTFSPDGDGINDMWRPSVFVHKGFHLLIFDRWGNVLFESNDPWIGWNGHHQNIGRECPIGTYSYQISIKDPELKEHYYIGELHLIR